MKQVGLRSGSQKARDFGRCQVTHDVSWSVMTTSCHACSCDFKRDVARQHYVSSWRQADVSCLGDVDWSNRIWKCSVLVTGRQHSKTTWVRRFWLCYGRKIRSPFLHHFHTKTTHFGFTPCCIVRLFSICCNVQKQIFFFGFIFWRHYVIKWSIIPSVVWTTEKSSLFNKPHVLTHDMYAKAIHARVLESERDQRDLLTCTHIRMIRTIPSMKDDDTIMSTDLWGPRLWNIHNSWK